MTEQILLTIENIREKEYEVLEGIDIFIKNYLPLSHKKLVVKKILDICIIEGDIKKIDFALKEFAFEYVLVNEFSNINFEVDDIVELYDELKKHEVLDKVLKLIPESEKEFIHKVLQKEIEQLQIVDNSLASVVSKQLSTLVEKLPDQKSLTKLIKDLPKQINKIDSSKFKSLAEAIGIYSGEKNA